MEATQNRLHWPSRVQFLPTAALHSCDWCVRFRPVRWLWSVRHSDPVASSCWNSVCIHIHCIQYLYSAVRLWIPGGFVSCEMYNTVWACEKPFLFVGAVPSDWGDRSSSLLKSEGGHLMSSSLLLFYPFSSWQLSSARVFSSDWPLVCCILSPVKVKWDIRTVICHYFCLLNTIVDALHSHSWFFNDRTMWKFLVSL